MRQLRFSPSLQSTVTIFDGRTDADGAGDGYAQRIYETLRGRCEVFRPRAEVVQ